MVPQEGLQLANDLFWYILVTKTCVFIQIQSIGFTGECAGDKWFWYLSIFKIKPSLASNSRHWFITQENNQLTVTSISQLSGQHPGNDPDSMVRHFWQWQSSCVIIIINLEIFFRDFFIISDGFPAPCEAEHHGEDSWTNK